MRKGLLGIVILVSIAAGCSPIHTETTMSPNPESMSAKQTDAPKDWMALVGQKVTVEGMAANAKLGAMLLGDDEQFWIDNLDTWPDGYYLGGDKGKRVRVTGTLIRREDMSVAVTLPDGSVTQGVWSPPEEEGKRRYAWRFLLKDATWTVLDP